RAERVLLHLRRGRRDHGDVEDDRADEQREPDVLLLHDPRGRDAAREREREQRVLHAAEYYPACLPRVTNADCGCTRNCRTPQQVCVAHRLHRGRRMPNITTPALESIDAQHLLSVSGGCCPPQEPPPPPTPLPTAQTMGPPQQTAGGDSVVN